MPFGLARRFTVAGATIAMAVIILALPPSAAAWAQTSSPDVTKPAAPTTIAPQGDHPADPFGEDATLTAKTIIYVKGTGTWDKAFETITRSFRKLKTYLDKEGLKTDGLPMTIFTATDDTGFTYQAAIPILEAPKNPPRGDIALGKSPEGRALKFVHRGSYDGLDNTYEAITNYLDDKRLETNDMFIEEYVTDPVGADENKLVVNVYVLVKPGQSSPG